MKARAKSGLMASTCQDLLRLVHLAQKQVFPPLEVVEQFLAVAVLPICQRLLGLLESGQRLPGAAQQVLRQAHGQPEQDTGAQRDLLADADVGQLVAGIEGLRQPRDPLPSA